MEEWLTTGPALTSVLRELWIMLLLQGFALIWLECVKILAWYDTFTDSFGYVFIQTFLQDHITISISFQDMQNSKLPVYNISPYNLEKDLPDFVEQAQASLGGQKIDLVLAILPNRHLYGNNVYINSKLIYSMSISWVCLT